MKKQIWKKPHFRNGQFVKGHWADVPAHVSTEHPSFTAEASAHDADPFPAYMTQRNAFNEETHAVAFEVLQEAGWQSDDRVDGEERVYDTETVRDIIASVGEGMNNSDVFWEKDGTASPVTDKNYEAFMEAGRQGLSDNGWVEFEDEYVDHDNRSYDPDTVNDLLTDLHAGMAKAGFRPVAKQPV